MAVQSRQGHELGEIRYELDPKKQWIALYQAAVSPRYGNHLQTMIDAAYQIQGDNEFLFPSLRPSPTGN